MVHCTCEIFDRHTLFPNLRMSTCKFQNSTYKCFDIRMNQNSCKHSSSYDNQKSTTYFTNVILLLALNYLKIIFSLYFIHNCNSGCQWSPRKIIWKKWRISGKLLIKFPTYSASIRLNWRKGQCRVWRNVRIKLNINVSLTIRQSCKWIAVVWHNTKQTSQQFVIDHRAYIIFWFIELEKFTVSNFLFCIGFSIIFFNLYF